MAMKKSLRPRARPDGLRMMPGDEMPSNRAATPIESDLAPRRSMRPRARPDDMEDIVVRAREAAAVERGNRGSKYEAEDYMIGKKEYAGGGKVKGYKNGGCVMAGRGGSFKGMK